MKLRSIEKEPPQHGERIVAYQRTGKGWLADSGYVYKDDVAEELEISTTEVADLGNYESWIPFPMPEVIEAEANELAEYKAFIATCDRCEKKDFHEFVRKGSLGLYYCESCFDAMGAK